jgi:hypothetical protein
MWSDKIFWLWLCKYVVRLWKKRIPEFGIRSDSFTINRHIERIQSHWSFYIIIRLLSFIYIYVCKYKVFHFSICSCWCQIACMFYKIRILKLWIGNWNYTAINNFYFIFIIIWYLRGGKIIQINPSIIHVFTLFLLVSFHQKPFISMCKSIYTCQLTISDHSRL